MKQINNQVYKKRILLLTFVVISIAGALLYYYQYITIKNVLDSRITYISKIIQKDFDANILETKEMYTEKVDRFVKRDDVRAAFASKDRKRLYELMDAAYQEQKILDPFLKIVTFRLSDGSAFLRLHKPEMYGDSLNKRRTIIRDVNREQKRLFGFEIGKLKMTYRVVTPIFYDGKYIGSVEVGILPDKFIDNISDLFDVQNSLVVKTEGTEVSLDKQQYLSENGFSLISDNQMFKKIFNLSFTEYKDKKNFLFTDSDDTTSYIIENNLELLNQNNQVVAKILLAHNITEVQENYHQTIKETLLIGILASIVLFFILNISFNRFIQKITESEELLNTVFDTTTESIGILDLESNFLLVNHAYEKMSGFTKKELYATSCKALTSPETLEATEKALSIIIDKGSYLNFEKSCFIKNGNKIDVMMNTVLMPDKQRILVTMHEITVQNRERKEKILREQYLIQQSRLAQMGEMISMIAHQWRQPLAAISTTTANLQMKIELDYFDMASQEGVSEANEYTLQRLENINGYVQSLTTTIDDFRNFYKPNKKFVTIKLSEIVLKSLSIVKVSFVDDKIELIEDYKDEESIELYDSEMMQVVLNILKNAQDNFQEKQIKNRKIIIKTENRTISICDNGGGIPEDIMDKIFNPYFSTKDEKNGTGLGLYMSKTIVEEHHHGKLLVENTEDGVCFTIKVGDIDEKYGAL
jgi:PAS domain S-box-containing protein